MTDNRTTELREKLDEAGIEYEICDMPSNAQTYWGDWCFMEPLDAKPHTLGAQCELTLIPATPEQAIAVTLGSGTLTAEQVSKAVYAHSIHADCADADWQAIADELNAELGSGTCKPTEPARCLDGTDCPAWLCSECGELFELGANFCSNCGAKVVSA